MCGREAGKGALYCSRECRDHDCGEFKVDSGVWKWGVVGKEWGFVGKQWGVKGTEREEKGKGKERDKQDRGKEGKEKGKEKRNKSDNKGVVKLTCQGRVLWPDSGCETERGEKVER